MRLEVVLTILCMAAATYFTRFASPLLLDRTGVPRWMVRLLKHVPTAMLAALIAEQLKPGRTPQRPAQDSCIQQPAQPLAGRQQQLAGDHCPSACKAWRNAPASLNWR